MTQKRNRFVLAVVVAMTALGAAAYTNTTTTLTNESSIAQDSPTIAQAELVDNTGLVVPAVVHVAPGADAAQAQRVVLTAQLLYTFWNTGDSSYLDRAVTPFFRDNTGDRKGRTGREPRPRCSGPRYRTCPASWPICTSPAIRSRRGWYSRGTSPAHTTAFKVRVKRWTSMPSTFSKPVPTPASH